MTIHSSPVRQRYIDMVMVEVLLHSVTILSLSTFCQENLVNMEFW